MLAIVIPAYKRPECLRQALESLTVQTNKKFFVVVVDDASPEPLEPVVKEFENKLHIKYLRQEKNSGPGVARQTGLDFIHERNIDLVMFMDSDDILYPNAVDRLTYEINVGLKDVVSSAIWTEQNKNTGFILSSDNYTWLHGKIYRVKYLYNNNIVFPSLRTNEDLAFNLKAILCTDKASYIDEVLYLFRDNNQSITRSPNINETYNSISVDYISAIYDAFRFFVNSKEQLPDQFITCILGLYNYYEIGKSIQIPNLSQYSLMLKEMYNQPQILNIVNTPSLLAKFSCVFKQFYYYKKQVYWFPQTLKEFLEEFVS